MGPAPKMAMRMRYSRMALSDEGRIIDDSGPVRQPHETFKSGFAYAHPLFWAPFVLVGD